MAWFSLRVREVPGSIPGQALWVQLFCTHFITPIRLEKWEQSMSVYIGLLVYWHDSRFGCESSRVQFPDKPFECPLFLLLTLHPHQVREIRTVKVRLNIHRLVGLVAWFSLRVREVPGSIPGQALWVYNCFVLTLHPHQVRKKENSQGQYTSACWSSGMILA